MKIKKGAAVIALGAGTALALGGTAMAASNPAPKPPPTATLKAAHATVKVGKEITLHGKFGPEAKKTTYVAVLEEKNAKGVYVAVKGVKHDALTKAGTYNFTLKADKKPGKETFEVAVESITTKIVKGKKVTIVKTVATSKPVTVTVTKK